VSPFKLRLNPWTTATLLVAVVVALPIIGIPWLALFPRENIWPHLISTVLPGYVLTTLGLMLGVSVGVLTMGVTSAWLVTMCRFPGRRVFEWAQLLPMAVPAYVVAYVYTDLLEYAGPVQSALRHVFGWQSAADYWFPEIRSLAGAIAMMSMVLYPYVYLLSRAAFLEQSVGLLDASRILGCGPWATFFRVSLPMARPSIAAGAALALMETLNDVGTVDFFAVQTLTLGIYDVWLNMGNIGGAAQIAMVMLVFVVALLTIERQSRRRHRHYQVSGRLKELPAHRLTGARAGLAFVACLMPVAAGFVIPAIVLVTYSIRYFDASWTPEFLRYALNSLMLSSGAALAAVCIALLLAYGRRVAGGKVIGAAVTFASFGYAVPGAVLAIGVIIPFAGFDNALDAFMRERFGISTGLLLSGTVAIPRHRAGQRRLEPCQGDAVHGHGGAHAGARPPGDLLQGASAAHSRRRADRRAGGVRRLHEGAPCHLDLETFQLRHTGNLRVSVCLGRAHRAGEPRRARHRAGGIDSGGGSQQDHHRDA
jgi:iron(III) transport system permease protein